MKHLPARPITFITWEVGVNLRDARWNKRFVSQVQRQYHLQPGEAVIFFNNAREFGGSGGHLPRSRIYWRCGDEMVVLIPAVDEGARQLSYQLRLNNWLRRFFNCPDDLLKATHDFDTSISRRQAARVAAKRRKAA